MLIVNMFGQIVVAFESRKCWKHARFQLYFVFNHKTNALDKYRKSMKFGSKKCPGDP